jgi:acetyltransferase-like isoleucine patch superfamily enzyme
MTYPDFVTVGAHTYHGELVLYRWGAEHIFIGKFCSIAQGVKIMAGGNHRTDAVSTYPFDTMLTKTVNHPTRDRSYDSKNGNIEIGNDVWIGYGASILGSCKIGHGAVIAANATVFTDIPPYAIAVGNPARVTKYRFDEATIGGLLRIAWWEWPESRIRHSIGDFYGNIADFVAQNDPDCVGDWRFDSRRVMA